MCLSHLHQEVKTSLKPSLNSHVEVYEAFLKNMTESPVMTNFLVQLLPAINQESIFKTFDDLLRNTGQQVYPKLNTSNSLSDQSAICWALSLVPSEKKLGFEQTLYNLLLTHPCSVIDVNKKFKKSSEDPILISPLAYIVGYAGNEEDYFELVETTLKHPDHEFNDSVDLAYFLTTDFVNNRVADLELLFDYGFNATKGKSLLNFLKELLDSHDLDEIEFDLTILRALLNAPHTPDLTATINGKTIYYFCFRQSPGFCEAFFKEAKAQALAISKGNSPEAIYSFIQELVCECPEQAMMVELLTAEVVQPTLQSISTIQEAKTLAHLSDESIKLELSLGGMDLRKPIDAPQGINFEEEIMTLTPIELGVLRGSKLLVQTLLLNNEIRAKEEKNATALMLAIQTKQLCILDLLMGQLSYADPQAIFENTLKLVDPDGMGYKFAVLGKLMEYCDKLSNQYLGQAFIALYQTGDHKSAKMVFRTLKQRAALLLSEFFEDKSTSLPGKNLAQWNDEFCRFVEKRFLGAEFPETRFRTYLVRAAHPFLKHEEMFIRTWLQMEQLTRQKANGFSLPFEAELLVDLNSFLHTEPEQERLRNAVILKLQTRQRLPLAVDVSGVGMFKADLKRISRDEDKKPEASKARKLDPAGVSPMDLRA